MVPILLALFFYSCSGIFDAIMDTLKDHFYISIFSSLNPQFWYPSYSWRNKYIGGDPAKGHKSITVIGIKMNFPDALSDAWHICKVIREGFNILAILSIFFITFSFSWPNVLTMLIALSIFRNLAFNFFYNKVLIK